jgi:hypothetical protein
VLWNQLNNDVLWFYSSHMIELEYVTVNVLDELGGQAVAGRSG